MRKIITAVIFILFTCVNFFAQETEKRYMTVDDALNMAEVGNALLSPDGNKVFFSKTELYWEKNKRKTKYFMTPANAGEAYQFIGKAGGRSFKFSPDGKYLSFKRNVDGESQIFIMPTTGGEAIQLTKHKNGIEGLYKWSSDVRKIFFVANEPLSGEEEKYFNAGYDALFVDEGPNGQTRGSWSNLWMIDLETRTETKITNQKFLTGIFDVSPDADRVIFIARYTNRRNDVFKNEVYIVSLPDRMITRLTKNNLPEGSLLWAPDGKSFAYTAQDDKEWLNRNPKIYIMNPNTKEYRLLSGEFEGSINHQWRINLDNRLFEYNNLSMVWTPDSRYILFNGQQGTNSNLYKIDVNTGDFQKLTNIIGTLSASSFSKDRKKMVFSLSDFDSPSDIYVSSVDSFDPQRLTYTNPWIEKELLLADMKLIKWKSNKGFEIEGLLYLPPSYKEGIKVPLILNVHGGPAGCFTNSFVSRYHVYAGLGYASLSPNVRGSRGYTDFLREGNTFYKGDGIGLGDFWDLMNGVDYVIKQGYVDPDCIGLRGWSYGGILGGYTITQTDRFKAAVIGAGVYSWSSEYGTGYNWDVRLWHIGGTPWDKPERWRHQSAFTHVKNITTPTLIMHEALNTSDTEQQAMMFFTAIKDIGKAPVRYIKFPREIIGLREPRHQRIRDIEELKWLQKFILGIDWKPWERKKEKILYE
ncbi:S9 family peptidase [Acidobacteriota bacterium]